MRLDLRFRLAREQGLSALRGACGFPMRRALLRGVVAAACVAGSPGASAHVSHDTAPFAPVTADLVDVPFFDAARTTWGGLHASSAAPLDVAYALPASTVPNVPSVHERDGAVARFGACVAYRVLCDAARGAVERAYASRFDYGLASALPAMGEQAAYERRPVDLAAAEP